MACNIFVTFMDDFQKSPKNDPKMLVFRIFWKLLPKMTFESRCLCGFQKSTVEIQKKPDRALTHFRFFIFKHSREVEIQKKPDRALTQIFLPLILQLLSQVEIQKKPDRALTHYLSFCLDLCYPMSRNTEEAR